MKPLDLTAEITALRDKAIQPRELAELFALATNDARFRRCRSYTSIHELLEKRAENN